MNLQSVHWDRHVLTCSLLELQAIKLALCFAPPEIGLIGELLHGPIHRAAAQAQREREEEND